MTAATSHFALVSDRVVAPEGVRRAAVIVLDGRIDRLVPKDEVPAGVPVHDVGGLVISPGLVDAHVHVNEPGRTDWEGFSTVTRAAAAGGVTTIVDMPLNSSPATTTVAALTEKRAAAAGQCWVDVGFHGGFVPDNLAEIEPLLDAGVCGVKAFLCDSGLADFAPVDEQQLRRLLPILRRRGVPLLVHAELPVGAEPAAVTSHPSWLASRPEEYERQAVELLRRLCREFLAPIHVVHLASGPLASHFFWAKQDGLPLTVETCPHYLHFYAERLQNADPRFKCAPPIRRKSDRDLLWEALVAGVIDTIGSDHSPCPPELKHLDSGDWQAAWGGISSIQLTLPVVWRGLRSYMIPYNRMADWVSRNPARLVGLGDRKGSIAPGYDADLCIWDPAEEWSVRGEELHHRHKLTPYEGERLRGQVKQTFVRGHLVYNEGSFPAEPIGQLLERPSRPAGRQPTADSPDDPRASNEPPAILADSRQPIADSQLPTTMPQLAHRLNLQSEDDARSALASCCAATAWVEAMLARRPFPDDDAVVDHAAAVWNSLGEADLLEAFAAHPMIGDVGSLRQQCAATAPLAAAEQSGVAAAADATLRELAELNARYRERFGFIFIVCAAGKTADEMLTILRGRVTNSRATELANAAAEQLRITQLRLRKLAAEPSTR